MYHRTVTTVVAIFVIAALFGTVAAPRAAHAQSASGSTWRMEDYGPRPGDDVVLKWNERLLRAIRLHPAQTGPTITARALAILHTATYDAWAAYDPVAEGTRLGGTLRRPDAERTTANKQKAISFAAYRVLTDLFPQSRYPRIGEADFPGLMRELGYDPADTTTNTATPQGIGNVVASALLQYRHTDGANQLGNERDPSGQTVTQPYGDYTGYTSDQTGDPWRWHPLCTLTPAGVTAGASPVPPDDGGCPGPNYARQTPLSPHWGKVTPFALSDPLQYRVTGPPKNPDGTYSTAEIDTALADTADLTDVEKATAEYWADGPATEFPPGHGAVFAQALSRRKGFTLDKNVQLFFILGNAIMDSSIAAWAWKYHYDFVRPVDAIRIQRRDADVVSWLGPNAGFGTVKGALWQPYQHVTVVSPPFPEYVSGHSTFSGATATVLATFNGSDTFGATYTIRAGSSKFEDDTPSSDVTLSWPTFSAAADEAGISRRYGGIHFQSGDYHGRTLGRQVAQFVWSRAQSYITGTISGGSTSGGKGKGGKGKG